MEERCGIWRLEHLLAVGGIGEVWRASGILGAGDTTWVAVKRLHTHLLRHEAVRTMFETEQRLLFDLPPHPGLCRGLDRGVAEGERPWVAMQLVEGLDLRRFLDGGAAERGTASAPRRLTAAQALPLMARVCDAVAHLHGCGWVHGDVVPANLLVDDALAQVALCDFGVARRAGAGGPVQGTHAYMAPEQVRGEGWTPATDVFALGVVLWELLEGKRLFHRGPPWLTMQAVLEQEVPALADATLDAVVQDALARDPGARIADAHALGRRLEACGAIISS
jgi:serine/threonine protein kinase